MPPTSITILLLICSNVFMTFAWYAHLKELSHKPWLIAAGELRCLISPASTGQSYWLHGYERRAIKNFTRSD